MPQHTIFSIGLIMLLCSCTGGNPGHNELSTKEKEEGWILLFDGKTTDGWHTYNKGKVNSTWVAGNGELYCDAGNIKLEHGDLLTDKEYENFDLIFEWKIKEAGNSGLFINVKEDAAIPTAWASGPEYQLLDQKHHDFPNESKRPGCLFGFGPQLNSVDANATGEWNQGRIKQVNGKIEFYLNGILTASEDFSAPEWPNKVSQSSFNKFPEFGKQTKGHIALQQWEKGIAFRNIKIKPL